MTRGKLQKMALFAVFRFNRCFIKQKPRIGGLFRAKNPEFTSHRYLFDQNSRAKLRTFSQSVNSMSLLVSVLPPVIFMISWMMRVCHQL